MYIKLFPDCLLSPWSVSTLSKLSLRVQGTYFLPITNSKTLVRKRKGAKLQNFCHKLDPYYDSSYFTNGIVKALFLVLYLSACIINSISFQVAMCNFRTIKDAADVAIATMLSGLRVRSLIKDPYSPCTILLFHFILAIPSSSSIFFNFSFCSDI